MIQTIDEISILTFITFTDEDLSPEKKEIKASKDLYAFVITI